MPKRGGLSLATTASKKSANSSPQDLKPILYSALKQSESEFYNGILDFAYRHSDGHLEISTISLLRAYVMQLAELYYIFDQNQICDSSGIEWLLTYHNNRIDQVISDPQAQYAMGISENRRQHLPDAKFSAQHIQRISDFSREKIWLEQADIAKLMYLNTSEETTRKLIVALAKHGFFERIKAGVTTFVISTGELENRYRGYLDAVLTLLHERQCSILPLQQPSRSSGETVTLDDNSLSKLRLASRE